MADHGTMTHPTTTVSTDPEALLEDRQQFWGSFMNATLGMVIFMVVLLVGMAVFLL
ncbi:MAG TPA: hypothetical protein VGG99_18355 [Acetobacteraceae bacterium]|jgi:hypothetical protein